MSSNRASLLWVVALAFAFAAALSGLFAARVQAQTFDVQQLRLVPNQQDNYFGQHSARILPAGGFEAGLVLDYANDPLVIVDSSGKRVASLVGDQLSGDVLFALGLFDRLELGLDVPLVLLQEGDALPSATAATGANAAFGLGDVHTMAKLSLWQSDTKQSPGGTAMALVVDAQLPTGNQDDFQGEGLRIEPRLVLDGVIPRSLRLSGQVGYLVRAKNELLGTQVDDTLAVGLGVDLPLNAAQTWHVIGETEAKITVLAKHITWSEIPLEAVFGGRYYSASGVMLELGGGVGINHGYGTPDYRLLAGVSYRPSHDPDPDHDGLLDDADLCPSDPEDHDDFDDEDGCPDPDNDHDQILDTADRCPNEPEDRDQFEDGDGCPDPDNDADGLPDVTDRCPNEPEDTDGFEDDDGCPDLDNDQDGLPDATDRCPNEPEDTDGFEDSDGCPDPDNDKDGLLDAADRCPDEAEDFDGFEDGDGCPEEGSGLVKLTCDKIAISDRVYFDTGKDTIQVRSFALLEQVASVLQSASYVKKLRVEGHTDDRGDADANFDLSTRRAAAVVRFLVEHGVAAERLSSEGFGETRPIANNRRSAGRSQNRRVEFVIAEQDAACAKP